MEVHVSVLFLSLLAASAMVSTATPKENDVRLVTKYTATRAGRVEVYHGGRWGSVCNQGFGMEDAKVVCRQWGYPAGALSVRYFVSRFGHGQGPFLLSNVRCKGTESKLTDCPASPWGQNRCTRNQEAGVMCKGTPSATPKENDIRLVSAWPLFSRLGRVEVYHEGRWGSVCNQDDFGMASASVACRQWGYRFGAYALVHSVGGYGSGSGPFWLSNVRCIGTEAKLADCPADPWGQNQCVRNQEAGIICKGDRTGQINAARGLYDMTEQLEDEAFDEKEEEFFQNLKEEDEAYLEKREEFLQNLKDASEFEKKEVLAEILAQLEDD